MTSRFARIAVFSLIVLLSACNMSVQIATKVNGKGGGTLGLTITLDKELRDVLEGSKGGQGLSSLETLFGRRRYIPELRDRNFNVRAFGERTATNSPLQGSAADLIKIAMIRIDRALAEQHLGARMVLQVHDELVFEVPEAEQTSASELVKRHMETAAELRVPLVVSTGVGRNWVDAKG